MLEVLLPLAIKCYCVRGGTVCFLIDYLDILLSLSHGCGMWLEDDWKVDPGMCVCVCPCLFVKDSFVYISINICISGTP